MPEAAGLRGAEEIVWAEVGEYERKEVARQPLPTSRHARAAGAPPNHWSQRAVNGQQSLLTAPAKKDPFNVTQDTHAHTHTLAHS